MLGFSNTVVVFQISDDNTFIFAFCKDTIHIWNMSSLERDVSAVEAGVDGQSSGINCVRLAPDERGPDAEQPTEFWPFGTLKCVNACGQRRSRRRARLLPLNSPLTRCAY